MTRIRRLNATLYGENAEKFERIKAYLGLTNDSEVVRILVTAYFKEHEEDLTGPPKTMFHLNVNKFGVLVWDPTLGEIIQINFHPEDGIQCERDETADCNHVIFALAQQEVKQIVRERRLEGWKLPEV